MIKTMFAFGALALAVPAVAQMTDAAAPAGAALPKCSATVRDSCDQSMTTERYAMSADAAMKTGGVGDRKSDNAGKGGMGGGMGAMPMHHTMMHHKHMMHHKMMKHSMSTPTPTSDAAAPATPQ